MKLNRVFLGFLAGGCFAVFSTVGSLGGLVGGLALALLGLLLRGWAAGYLEKGKKLAQDGPYAVFRHPLYQGSFLMALGLLIAGTTSQALARGALLGVAFVFLFAWVYPRRIVEEEATLEKIFGEAWRQFVSERHRFFPRWPPYRRDHPDVFLWSRYLKNREYQAALGYGAALVLLTVKWLVSTSR